MLGKFFRALGGQTPQQQPKIQLIPVSPDEADRLDAVLKRYGNDNARMGTAATEYLKKHQFAEAIEVLEVLIRVYPENSHIAGLICVDIPWVSCHESWSVEG
jgi:hypothetical protein